MGLEEELNQIVLGVKEMLWIFIIMAVLILAIFILIILERKLKKILRLRKKSRIFYYRKEIKKLNKLTSPQKILDAINEVARNFFKEAFNLSHNLEYSELTEEFRKTGKKECISFCKLISELNYSGEKIEKNKIKALTKLLEKITEKNRIPSEEFLEKEKLKAKEKKIEERKKKFKKHKPKKIFKLKPILKIKNLVEKTKRIKIQKIKLPKLKLGKNKDKKR